MGCWNGTCNISNMPILEGDKVVLISLMKISNGTTFNTCYPTDNFIPLGFPIIGYYNDYGGLYDIEISDVNKDYFKSLNFYFYNKGKNSDEKYIKVPDYDNFEDFVNNVLCTVEGCYIDVTGMDIISQDLIQDNMSEINFMMVHYDLYCSLMNSMRNRKPFGKEDTFEVLLTNLFKGILKDNLDKLNQAYGLSKIDSDESIIDTFKDFVYKDITYRVFNPMDNFFENRWNYFVDILLSQSDKRNEIIDFAVNKYVFTTVLSRMRKGYLCDSGCGSQCEETKLHLIMADFIRDKIIERAKVRNESENGVEGFIFF